MKFITIFISILSYSLSSYAGEGKVLIEKAEDGSNAMSIIIKGDAAKDLSKHLLINGTNFEYSFKYRTTVQIADGVICEKKVSGLDITCFIAVDGQGVYVPGKTSY